VTVRSTEADHLCVPGLFAFGELCDQRLSRSRRRGRSPDKLKEARAALQESLKRIHLDPPQGLGMSPAHAKESLLGSHPLRAFPSTHANLPGWEGDRIDYTEERAPASSPERPPIR
jgi:hypothetical protein